MKIKKENPPHVFEKKLTTGEDTSEDVLLESFQRNEHHSLKTLLGLYKGQYFRLFLSVLLFAIKHSPVWVLPIATANIINAATGHEEQAVQTIIVNTVIMAVLIVQNVLTNYFHTYFSTIVNQVSGIITLIPIIAKGLESVNSIGDILLCADVEDTGNKRKLKNVNGTIEFQHLCFKFKDADKPVIKDLTLCIHQGETVAFVGASGAGKSTLLNLVIGFLRPQSGKILIDGNDLSEINLQSYRKHISVVPQTPILFTGTIRENITYGAEDIDDDYLNAIIQAANLEDLIAALPDGLDTMVNEHGANLSGGQRQRVSIARAFVRNPKILILDEATSALDSISEKKIQDSVDRLVKDRTTLIVAHRLSTIRNADKIAVIGDGDVMEYGTYDELMEKKGAFYQLRSMQI